MKNLKLTLFALLCIWIFSVQGTLAQVSFGSPTDINNGWLFLLQDEPQAKNQEFNDSKWRTLDLPHDWSIEGQLSPTLASCTGYLPGGIGWYRKHITVPQDQEGKKQYIYFEGVYNRSEVYVNGNLVGKRPNGYVSFMYDITPLIRFGEDNVIAVRVDHSRSADSRWYTGSGIYRNVFLISANPVHIGQWGLFYQTKSVEKNEAFLNVQVNIENSTKQSTPLTINISLVSADGKTVAKGTQKLQVKPAETAVASLDMKLKNPVLWKLDNPYLYTLKTEIIQNNKIIDQTEVQAGIRTLTFDSNKGFALNGEWMKLKGVCIHHDAGALGSAVPAKVWERRLENLKTLGCNAIRLSHNPQSPYLYELCDKHGILVLDEAFDEWKFAKRKWLAGWNKGAPGFEGSFDFFEEWSDRDVTDMVLRDRNHPSVIMWSIGNEIDYPNDPYSHPVLDKGTINQPVYGGYKPDSPQAVELGEIAKQLAADVRKIDRSRPVTAALAGVIMSNETEYPGALDVVGYNYTEDRYETDHKKYPQRIIYGSENGQGMSAWKSVRDSEYIFAQFLWAGIDYLGESGPWPSRGFYTGLLDFGGFQKPRGYFRQALWSSKPVTYIGTYPAPENRRNLSMDAWPIWNYEEGKTIRVVCYTNCQKSKLFLNGVQQGDEKALDDNTGIVSWDIPYHPGKLEVVGYNNEQEACRYAIQSSERPFALTAIADYPTLSKEKDLTHVVIQVVDEKGVPVMLADDEVKCTIEGPAKLLGLEAGNNSDMGNYRDNAQRVFHGRLLAYIQTTGEAGKVKITFTSPWLKPVEVNLETK